MQGLPDHLVGDVRAVEVGGVDMVHIDPVLPDKVYAIGFEKSIIETKPATCDGVGMDGGEEQLRPPVPNFMRVMDRDHIRRKDRYHGSQGPVAEPSHPEK